jgi:phosphate transport system protein
MGSFVAELAVLRSNLVQMGLNVNEMLKVAVGALIGGDEAKAKEVIIMDKSINDFENRIVDKAIHLIATNQPVAGDLRFLASSLRLATELERMGDLGSNLARRTITLNQLQRAQAVCEPFPEDLVRMSERTMAMLEQALKAFNESDPVLAELVLGLDDEIDDYNKAIRSSLIEKIYHDGHKVSWGLEIIHTAIHLERLGDHATNLAEETIYMARGKNVRHHHI